MFPWFAFGRFIPFLHLSNKLAEKGHRISFLLPKGVRPTLEQISQYPNQIRFIPLVVSDVDGLPPGAETASDVHLAEHKLFTILRAIKLYMVFYDLAHWIPALALQLGIKSLFYCVVSASACTEIPKKVPKEPTQDQERNEISPGYPCSKVRHKDKGCCTKTSDGKPVVISEPHIN
ncbi:hypothetical protein CRYUN_Cryun39dG0042900 [Craigia yunnanensis]